MSSTSIIGGGGGATPFHKVRGATGNGKGKINHFIWGKQGGDDTPRDERNRWGSRRLDGREG